MIGVHRNQGGQTSTINPVGEYAHALLGARLRPFIVVIGEGGHAAELHTLGCEVAFAKDDWRFAPNYESNNPKGDAAARWQLIKEAWPPELSKEAWCIVLNEPRKEAADYVHRFMLEFAKLANADGHRVTGPNWSVGTPSIDAWETDAGRAWLRYCGEHPDMASVGLHEYSLNAAELESGAPWLIGRYQFILDVCDDHGIPHPRFLICECGWTNDNMPDAETALAQMPFLHETYGDIDLALWTLGAWSSGPNLPPKLAEFMPVLTDWIVENVEPDNGEEPMPTLVELIWSAALASKRISHSPKAALGAAIRADGYWPLGPETDVVAGDATYRLQLGKFPEGDTRRAYFVKVPNWGEVFYTDNGIDIHTWGDDSGPVAWLDVPYLSQWTPDADASSGDCGPATVAMIANYYGHAVTVNQAAIACGQQPGSNVTFISQLQRGLDHYGVKHEFVRPASLDYLRQQLRDGNPAILLIHYGSLVGNQDTFTGGHFFVTVGYGTDDDGDYFLVNDSNFWGARIADGNHRRIAAAVLAQAMDDAVKDGNYPRQVIVATGKVDAPDPPAQPTVDLLPYLKGDGRLYEVRNAAGSQERFQSQTGTGNVFYQTKNTAWEMLYFDSEYIYRDIDTSPGGGRYYRLMEAEQSGFGSRWIPRHWRPGEQFTQKRRVQFYDKATCQPLSANSGDVTDTMQFVARHDSYTFRTGIRVNDVVELLWTNGGERYFYARGFGLVGWERAHQDPHTPAWSAISEIHDSGSRPDNQREEIGCL